MTVIKCIIIKGIAYDELINKLTGCGYNNFFRSPLSNISIHPDFNVVLSISHDGSFTDLALRIYNPDMLIDPKVKEVLLEYII